jgi:hypothetical protein
LPGKCLDGDRAIQARIDGTIDLAHAAGGDQRLYFVGAKNTSNQPAGHRRLLGASNGACDWRKACEVCGDGGKRHEVVRRAVIGEQRFDFTAQLFITAAGVVQKRGALGGVAFQGCVIQPFDLAPSFRRHLLLFQLAK